MSSDIFAEVEKSAENAGISRPSWRGVLSLDIPSLGLGSVEYHLKGAKAHGDQQAVKFIKVDSVSGKEVVSREVPRLFRYKLGPNNERVDVLEIPAEEVKESVRYNGDYHVFARNERRFFLKDDLEVSGKWIEVSNSQVIDRQADGQTIEPFDRTTKIEVEPDGFVPLERLEEYKFKEVYELGPDTDAKVKETPARVKQLARYLLEKQTALVSFFSWGRGYQFYTAVVYPYERKKDGRLWLLMGLSEGVLKLDPTWSLEEEAKEEESVPPVPVAEKRKPKVTISK